MTPPAPALTAPAPPRPPLPTRRVALRLAAVAAVLAFLGLFPLIGIPGALWMMPGGVVAGFFTTETMRGDAAWPMAIILTILWPWFLPLGYLGAAAWLPRGQARWIATLAATAVGATLLAAAFQVQAGVMT